MLIQSPQKVDATIRAATAQVSASVHPCARRARVRHEALRRDIRSAQIAACQRQPADAQLAESSNRCFVAEAVQHLHAARCIRLADRDDALPGVRLIRLPIQAGDCRFGGTVEIVKADVRKGSTSPLREGIARQALSADGDLAQCGQFMCGRWCA
ncbi:hypothetical protein YK56LOC_36160 [Caballeronia sp. HLA56]